jgi:hypothetical protein
VKKFFFEEYVGGISKRITQTRPSSNDEVNHLLIFILCLVFRLDKKHLYVVRGSLYP